MSVSADRPVKRQILVVTANESTAGRLTHLLARFSYSPLRANDGKEALELIGSGHPDCVIAEFLVPGMDPVDLLTAARQIKPGLPVLFLVPGSDAAAESRCSGYGASGCICKPVQAEDLFATLQAVLEPHPRTAIRIKTVLPVQLNEMHLGARQGIELSERGMYLPVDDPQPGGELAIRLQIMNRTISTDAAVVYSQPVPSGTRSKPGMGLKFLTLSSPDREFLRQYIRDEITRES